jgi:transcriptional regulator with XRE-family HTH domain
MSLEPKPGSTVGEATPVPLTVLAPRGRPRREGAHRAILEAFRELLIEDGFARLRLEHVAARAGVSKATIYRRWRSKEELAIELLHELAAPFVAIPDAGDTRGELVAATQSCIGRTRAARPRAIRGSASGGGARSRSGCRRDSVHGRLRPAGAKFLPRSKWPRYFAPATR